MATSLPRSILIVGGGVFGLSTALSLSERHPESQIIVVESSPTIPNPHGSSVDSSRVIRADYFNPTYAKLGTEALERWRSTGWGQSGRYSETGLLLVYPEGDALAKSKVETYYDNVKGTVQEGQVEWLPTRQAVQKVVPHYNISDLIGGGYVNWTGGWADAAEGVRYAKSKLDQRENVTFRTAEVNRLLFEGESETQPSRSVKGVILSDGSSLVADLVILATGAWTPKLVDLRGRAEATGQVMAYVNITDEEQRQLENMPTILNLGTGMFTIPPRGNVLKVARHGYGYRNMQKVATAAPAHRSNEADETIEVSIPKDGISIPLEGEQACRIALKELFPSMADRPFIRTRVCWYTDTPTGDFIITYHPDFSNLFLATGGSGHGYKFFPVLGGKIVDALEGRLDPELEQIWRWPAGRPIDTSTPLATEDGSRCGKKGMMLSEELRRT